MPISPHSLKMSPPPPPPPPPATTSFASVVAIDVEHGEDPNPPSGNSGSTSTRRRCMTSLRTFGTALSTTLSSKPKSHWILLFTAVATTLTALVASSLLPRSYYQYGNSENFWVMSWFISLGWPLAAILLLPFLFLASSPSPLFTAPLLFFWYPILGLLTAVANSIFAGIYYLPWGMELRNGTDNATISSFHGATTVVFAAIFGFWLAKNRVGAWGVNAVVVVAVAALAVAYEFIDKEEEEEPAGTFFLYIVIMDLPVSFLRGLILALTERAVVRKSMRSGSEDATTASPSPLVTVRVALEVQLLVSLFAFAFSCIGFFVVGGFGKVEGRAGGFEGGKTSYYMVLAWSAVAFQLVGVGGAMLVGLSSTTFGGILGSVRLPVTSLLAMAFFHDALRAYVVFGMVLAIWALGCYGFGNLKY